MRFTSRDILAETTAAIARENISKPASINGKQVPFKLSAVVSKASINSAFRLSTLPPKAKLKFATFRRNLQILFRAVISLFIFFPLFFNSILSLQTSFFSETKLVWGIRNFF